MWSMWSMMMSWQYEMFRRQSRARGNEDVAHESLPVARAGRNGLLHRTVGWLGRQLTDWQAFQDELDRPTGDKHPLRSGELMGDAL